MQFRIKNDLDGLEFPDCQGLFSYLAAVFFWEYFWEDKMLLGSVTPILGIAKYQEVLLCVRKVTREGVKRRI